MQTEAAAELFERAQLAERQARSDEALELLATCGQWPVPYNERGLLLRAEILISRDPIAALDELPETADAFMTHEGRVGLFLTSARAYMNARNLRASDEMLNCAKGEMFEGDPQAYRLAFLRALLRWISRDYDPQDSDLEFAISSPNAMERLNALNLRAWMHSGKENYRQQFADFVECLDIYRTYREECRIKAVAGTLQSILGLAWEVGDFNAARSARAIFETLRWTAELEIYRFCCLRGLAWHSFLEGDDDAVARFTCAAISAAPTVAWRMLAYCDAAYIAHLSTDESRSTDLLQQALDLDPAIDWHATRDEERAVLLTLGALLVRADPATAERHLLTYRRLQAHSMHPNIEASHEPHRIIAAQQYVEGRIAHVRGNMRPAIRLLTNAHATFLAVDHFFRAALAALALFHVKRDERWLAEARKHAAAFPEGKLVRYITP